MSGEPGRRSLLAMLAAYAALTAAVITGSLAWRPLTERAADARSSEEHGGPHPDPATLAFLGPLVDGTAIQGWYVARVGPLVDGRVELEVVRTGGAPVRLMLARWSAAAPPPAARADEVAIYVFGGPGAIDPPSYDAAEALAGALRDRAAAGHAPPALEALAPE